MKKTKLRGNYCTPRTTFFAIEQEQLLANSPNANPGEGEGGKAGTSLDGMPEDYNDTNPDWE